MENEVQEQTTFAERTARLQEQARTKLFEKKAQVEQKPKIALTPQEREFAQKTMPLAGNEGFQAFRQLCQMVLADKVKDRIPPENWLPKETTWGEKCSFHQGLMIGLQLHLTHLDNLWRIELDIQESESKTKKE